jgi:nanoRNase/pAp phosphatase (c-di-AMP/oligoRNAs hydrolase)
MLKYGGGGHKAVGTCQFPDETMDEMVPKLLKELVELSEQ